jgi:epoxyqueuosine reductase
MTTTRPLADRIRDEALRIGFDVVGIAPAQASRRAGAFRRWIDEGRHGTMAWLARDPERRVDPAQVVPGVKSVIAVGLSYYTGEPPADVWDDPLRGRIARYAWGRDYHDTMLPMLRELEAFVAANCGTGMASRCYVDTGPVLEREQAYRAGLGFIGKHTLLINQRFGSFVLLGEILTDVELDYDRQDTTGTCGNCRRCQDVCPTHAFPSPYILDSRLCISYLTIELREAIPANLRPLMKNWIFGCDECQSICPWVRRYARPGAQRFLGFDAERFAPRLADVLVLDEDGFRDRYRGTPIVRTKRRGLLRNACVALGNSGDASMIPVLERALHDAEPLVREHAEWAIGKLGSPQSTQNKQKLW